jgi:deoxycytidylate deaminase
MTGKENIPGAEEALFINAHEEAAKQARQSQCSRAKCGAVILSKGIIIGRGSNGPLAFSVYARCNADKSLYHRKVTDKTCCIHAEQRAILDALKNRADEIVGSALVFARVNESGVIISSGEPYCTICSKMILEVGIKNVILKHEDGLVRYGAEFYNSLSYSYLKNEIIQCEYSPNFPRRDMANKLHPESGN